MLYVISSLYKRVLMYTLLSHTSSYCIILVQMLKWCIQYVSKFGKPSSGHRTKKSQSSSHFPRRAVLKNIQTTRQSHSLPMLVRLCLKSFKLGFSSTWIKNFHEDNIHETKKKKKKPKKRIQRWYVQRSLTRKSSSKFRDLQLGQCMRYLAH